MTLDQLTEQLFAETSGMALYKLLPSLLAYQTTHREQVVQVLMRYAREGRIEHLRSDMVSRLTELAHPNEAQARDFFAWTLTQPQLAYWGAAGLLKAAGTQAYVPLIVLATEATQPLEVRAHAVKLLAQHSQQHFDRNLPTDPGYWKPAALAERLSEVLAWQQQGYPLGPGYPLPPRHASLDAPRTPLEQAAAALDQRLALGRPSSADPANPRNALTPADPADLAAIEQRYRLPASYQQFLARYSPLRVSVYKEEDEDFQEDFPEGISLYGAPELLAAQAGYATDGNTGTPLADWPAGYLVIADAGADPFCLATAEITDDEAPVYYARHGEGEWAFERYADTFVDFLWQLA